MLGHWYQPGWDTQFHRSRGFVFGLSAKHVVATTERVNAVDMDTSYRESVTPCVERHGQLGLPFPNSTRQRAACPTTGAHHCRRWAQPCGLGAALTRINCDHASECGDHCSTFDDTYVDTGTDTSRRRIDLDRAHGQVIEARPCFGLG